MLADCLLKLEDIKAVFLRHPSLVEYRAESTDLNWYKYVCNIHSCDVDSLLDLDTYASVLCVLNLVVATDFFFLVFIL